RHTHKAHMEDEPCDDKTSGHCRRCQPLQVACHQLCDNNYHIKHHEDNRADQQIPNTTTQAPIEPLPSLAAAGVGLGAPTVPARTAVLARVAEAAAAAAPLGFGVAAVLDAVGGEADVGLDAHRLVVGLSTGTHRSTVRPAATSRRTNPSVPVTITSPPKGISSESTRSSMVTRPIQRTCSHCSHSSSSAGSMPSASRVASSQTPRPMVSSHHVVVAGSSYRLLSCVVVMS